LEFKYVVPIGHGFSFFVVMEKSWKISVEKRGAPWYRFHSLTMSKYWVLCLTHVSRYINLLTYVGCRMVVSRSKYSRTGVVVVTTAWQDLNFLQIGEKWKNRKFDSPRQDYRNAI